MLVRNSRLVPVLAQAAYFTPKAASSNLEKRQSRRCQSVDPRDCQKDKREELDAARLEDEEEDEE
ncbi:hypothetical protein CDEST_13936 [Colletotrichum destructivum]|uniref:Uncharacterized protein n=1 Tax=Colletotrichum destructivum TaxID=34406 RepID=A0AAX4J0K1_9PEZI|nr:hypothetical protein CDEST_13936 [Colletotrichum destructivum]